MSETTHINDEGEVFHPEPPTPDPTRHVLLEGLGLVELSHPERTSRGEIRMRIVTHNDLLWEHDFDVPSPLGTIWHYRRA